MAKRYCIAYGSNLNILQMRMCCLSVRIIGISEVQNYRLLFKGSKTGAYLTIEPFEGGSFPVAAWEVSEDGTGWDWCHVESSFIKTITRFINLSKNEIQVL